MSGADCFFLGMAIGAITAGVVVIYAAAVLMPDKVRR
jgi:hypothetical protein